MRSGSTISSISQCLLEDSAPKRTSSSITRRLPDANRAASERAQDESNSVDMSPHTQGSEVCICWYFPFTLMILLCYVLTDDAENVTAASLEQAARYRLASAFSRCRCCNALYLSGHSHHRVRRSGDGVTKNTEAFRNAITACNEAGGGQVLVPPGKWLTGAIHLQSNVNLHLQEGAEIHFSDDPDDYLPVVFTRWAGIEAMNYSPLIYANGCSNIAITGKGALYGHGDAWWDWCTRLDEMDKVAPALMDMAARGAAGGARFGSP